MAINYTIEKHTYAFPSKLLASNGGKHIYNIEVTTDTDNGNLIGRGDWTSLDLYEEAEATKFTGIVHTATNGNFYVEVTDPGDALLAYNVPMIAEEYNNDFKKISNYYNKAGDRVRSYDLAIGDVFEVSAEAFTVPASAAEGKKVTGISDKKMVLA